MFLPPDNFPAVAVGGQQNTVKGQDAGGSVEKVVSGGNGTVRCFRYVLHVQGNGQT
jgi:hypothetical protein